MSRNRGDTSCECRLPFPARVYSAMTRDEYMQILKIGPDHPYWDNHGYGWQVGHPTRHASFAHHRCACGRQYALWVAEDGDPESLRLGRFCVYDSSFFFAFDDEPSELDEPKLEVALAEARAELDRVSRERSELLDHLRSLYEESGR